MDVDRERQRRPPEWLSRVRVDDGEIDARMVDLDEVERLIRNQASRRCQEPRLGLGVALPPAHQLRLVLPAEPARETPKRGVGRRWLRQSAATSFQKRVFVGLHAVA